MGISKREQNNIEKAGFRYLEVGLHPGPEPKQWLCPQSRAPVSVEKAVLSHFETEGWRGYSGEGGLILNLIKAMSFKSLPARARKAYVESLYLWQGRGPLEYLDGIDFLENIRNADATQVSKNFHSMLGLGPPTTIEDGRTVYVEGSILDFFPGLEEWMATELLEVAGNELLFRIAEIFAEDPFEYRRGWPDITIWRNDAVRFIEVKAPGDKLQKSQKVIATKFAGPLGLDFRLASVIQL